MQNERYLSSDICEEDTRTLEESTNLQYNFNLVMDSFTKSFEEGPDSYCTASKNGAITSTECVVDYSTFSAHDTYTSLCEVEGGGDFSASILMRCSRENEKQFLDMDLLNIPSCVGKSCDAGHLYQTLLQILNNIQNSIGEGNWQCKFFHDFDSLISAPAVIEVPVKGESGANTLGSTTTTSLLVAVLSVGISMLFL
jgi:hypothetical protein